MLKFCKIPFDYLKFTGNDRLDLINRLSTNKTDNLGKFKGIKTVLTSDKGRIIDILTLYSFGEFVFVLCSFNNSNAVIAHLDKYTIMDDFKVTDMTSTHETILFTGDEAGKFTSDMFEIDISGFENNDFKIYSIENRDAIIARNDDAFGGFYFTCAMEDSEFFKKFLFESDKAVKYYSAEISPEEYEYERVILGIPEFGKEITGETNPLECGLNKYVSFTKGCYIGQEVIARLDAYDKISRHMVGFDFKGNFPVDFMTGEMKIMFNEKECGFVTSTAGSGEKGYTGLGFIKTVFLNFDEKYKIKSPKGEIEIILKRLN